MNYKEACSAWAQLIEAVPELWCREKMAYNDCGWPVSWSDPTAVRWCMVGGIAAATGREPTEVREWMYNNGVVGVYSINDYRGRLWVIRVLRQLAGEFDG